MRLTDGGGLYTAFRIQAEGPKEKRTHFEIVPFELRVQNFKINVEFYIYPDNLNPKFKRINFTLNNAKYDSFLI